jgi:subtilisin family serine protease
VQTRAAAQRPIEEKLFASYQRAGTKTLPQKQQLAVSPIGSSALPVASVEITPKTLPVLAEQPDVVAILPNQKIHLILPKEVEYEALSRQEEKDGLTWGLKRLEIPKLWKTTRGKDINVAVLDTGVYSEHPALAGRVQDFVVVDPLGRRVTAKPTFDCGTHGTHVCGTIAGGKTDGGVSIGVAPEANLLVAGVLIGDATLQTLVEGISWAVEKGADIINMSLGFTYYEPLFAEVFQMLLDQYGVLPVVAIGNENHGNCSSPGNAWSGFSVGAAEKMPYGKLGIAPFSSGASLVFPGAEPNALVTKPDVVAPGVQIYSSIPPEKKPSGIYEYSYMDGTSMATPHVSGVAALLMAAYPEAPVTDIMQALKETAHHPEGENRRPDNRWGYGMIRPVEAFKALAT